MAQRWQIDDEINFSCVETVVTHAVKYDLKKKKKNLELIFSVWKIYNEMLKTFS